MHYIYNIYTYLTLRMHVHVYLYKHNHMHRRTHTHAHTQTAHTHVHKHACTHIPTCRDRQTDRQAQLADRHTQIALNCTKSDTKPR